jgi:SAM-dependent methyltransferase
MTVLDGDRVAVHVPDTKLSAEWERVWNTADSERIGELLDFPACCRRFFTRTWDEGARETSLAQYAAAGADGPAGCNLLLRQLGVRLVPHLACSFQCEKTASQADAFAALADPAQLWDLQALLSLPAEYSSLHGTGCVTTPVFKLEFDVDPGPLQRFSRQALVPLVQPPIPEPETWSDNGFSSAEAMERAHTAVCAAVSRLRGGSALDLGCGDGALLERLRKRDELKLACGYDADAERIKRGSSRHPHLQLLEGRIEELPEDAAEKFDLVLLMPGRLLEMPEAQAQRVRRWLMQTKRLVLYTYEADLAGLCRRAALPIPQFIVKGYAGVTAAGRSR